MPLRLAVHLGIAILANHAVTIGRAATGNHHVAVFNLGHACHAARHLLKAFAMRGAQFGQEINIATQGDGTVQVGLMRAIASCRRCKDWRQVGGF